MSKLRNLNVSENVEKKGQFNYLSWAWAVDQLIEHHPDATWEVKHFPMMTIQRAPTYSFDSDGEVLYVANMVAVPEMQVPYMRTDTGYFVEVSVTVGGVTRSQIHPVLDHRNKPIDKPSSFDINTAIQRCLAKAIALHGLGLYIYAGEDLPPEEKGAVSGDVVDMDKVGKAINYIKQQIDEDDPDHAANNLRSAWERLTSDEQLKVHEGLKDKAPGTNRMYKTLLKDYLNAGKEEAA